MNHLMLIVFLLCVSMVSVADDSKPLVYLNKNIGFNALGFKYNQKSFPCDIDKSLITGLVEQSKKRKIPLEVIGTREKVRNGTIPVLSVDVEQLVLAKKGHNYGTKKNGSLPMIRTTAAILKGKNLITTKNICTFANLREFTPSSDVLDLGTTTTVCQALRRCAKDLSKDIMTWTVTELK
jgi:hypothetical protein